MTGYLREGGRVGGADGSLVLWSVAEGRRGRRWRSIATRDGVIARSLLLEVDLAGRVSRLELTAPGGLLTLHPESDGRSIHGNVVSGEGVRPLSFPWGPQAELDVGGDPIPLAVGLHRLRTRLEAGRTTAIPVIAIDGSLAASPALRMIARLDDARWQVADADSGATWVLELDGDGVPKSDLRWPLE